MENKQLLFDDTPIHTMSIILFLDGVGFYGPIIVILCIGIALYKLPKYMWVFFIGIITNGILNKYLKSIFLEDRPLHPIPFSKYEKYSGIEKYGMPSGHSASIGFSIIYLLLVKPNSVWVPICIAIGILTLYQRWKYRRHTVEQIVIGFITGGLFGWIVYELATKYIVWL
jgi:membrane-associated phospholipid phosphatase